MARIYTNTVVSVLLVVLSSCIVLSLANTPQPGHRPGAPGEFKIYDLNKMDLEEFPVRKPLDLDKVDDETYWLRRGNLASLLELSTPPALQIPIPVNLVLIGFHHGGNGELQLSEKELYPWFEHIEHTIRHTMTDPTVNQSHVTPHIQYKFHFNVIEFGHSVNQVIERAILHHLRPELPEVNGYFHLGKQKLYNDPPTVRDPKTNKTGPANFQADPQKIGHILEHLIHSFNFNHSYSLFVLNPRPHTTHGSKYGYRAGYSEAEIQHMRAHPEIFKKKEAFEPDNEPRYFPGTSKSPEELREAVSADSPERYMSDDADLNEAMQWKVYQHRAEVWAKHYLEEWNQRPLHAGEFGPDVEQLHFSGIDGLETVIQQTVHKGSYHDHQHLREVRSDKHLHEDCLVDTWNGHGRMSFIDISAGPFNWGPVVGGEGVRTEETLPSIAKMQKDDKAAKQHFEKGKDNLVENQEERYEQLVSEREILLEEFEKSCWSYETDEMVDTEACQVLMNDIDERDQQLEKIRDGDLNLLGQVHGDTTSESKAENLARDNFLAHLGSVLSSSLRHIVTPSTAVFPVYREKVAFHIFVISNHKSYKPKKNLHLNDFKREMLKLKLPHQQFSFTVHSIAMQDDISLATAYQTSLRSAVVPTLRVNGKFHVTKRLYLDSQVLAAHLKHNSILENGPRSSSVVQHIPIFVFSVDYPLPLFIDKYHQAKTTDGIVLVVQSPQQDWESHLQCNNRPVYWNLRTPLSAALAATMQALAGILPSHVAYSEAHQRTTNNWLWSVGENPLSFTSSRHNFTTVHRDYVQRAYLAGALHEAHRRATHATDTLRSLKTTYDNFVAVQNLPFFEVREAYWDIEETSREMLIASGELDYATACAKIPKLMELVAKYEGLVEQCEKNMLLHRCPRPQRRSQYMSFLAMFGVLLVAVVTFILYRRYSVTKIKIN